MQVQPADVNIICAQGQPFVIISLYTINGFVLQLNEHATFVDRF